MNHIQFPQTYLSLLFIYKQQLEVTNVTLIDEARDMKENTLCHHTRMH